MGESFASFNARNIYKYITDKRALFLCLDALDFKDTSGEPNPCLKIRCCEIDKSATAGARISAEVDTYLPMSEFLVLTQDVVSGSFLAIKKNRNDSQKYSAPYFTHFGGSGSNGTLKSRCFSVVDGLGDCAFAFLATCGDGTRGAHGQIQPLPGKKPDASIFINLPNSKLKEFLLVGKAYLEAYIALDLEYRLSKIRNQREMYLTKRKE